MRGQPYRSTPNGVVGSLTCGQWVRMPGYKKPARFVRYNTDGTAHVVTPNGRGRKARVNMKAFRLACGKSLVAVLGTVPITGKVVNIGIAGDVTDVTPEVVQTVEDDKLEEAIAALLDLIM
jgi:hypothetical protein